MFFLFFHHGRGIEQSIIFTPVHLCERMHACNYWRNQYRISQGVNMWKISIWLNFNISSAKMDRMTEKLWHTLIKIEIFWLIRLETMPQSWLLDKLSADYIQLVYVKEVMKTQCAGAAALGMLVCRVEECSFLFYHYFIFIFTFCSAFTTGTWYPNPGYPSHSIRCLIINIFWFKIIFSL